MAIDLLGKKQPKKIKQPEKIIYHQPIKEKEPAKSAQSMKTPDPKSQPVIKVAKEELGEVNLITSFKAYLRKKIIFFSLIGFVLVIAIISCFIYLINRSPEIIINTNVNKPINTNINKLPESICGNDIIEAGEQCDGSGCGADEECLACKCQSIILPSPICGNGLIETSEECDQTGCKADQVCVNCLCLNLPPRSICGNGVIETGEACDLYGCPENLICNDSCQCEILPDTELAPLRGALVKFNDKEDIFLVETNGELRLVDQKTVIFKYVKNILQLADRIYLINNRYQNIRQGKMVKGYVDWDPRVLTEIELEPFK